MISGQIKKILTQKDNDWGRYQINDAGKDYLAVGVIPGASIGMTVSIDGYEETTKWGKQFTIKTVLTSEADKSAGVRRFLADGYVKGIGPTKADAIISKFGASSADLFDTPEGRALLCTVKGISSATIENAMPSYNANKKYKDIIVFLGGTVTKNQVEHIWEKYGEDSLSVLKKNPYRLQMDLDGFGFLKADTLALASGIKKDSPYRIMAAIKYVIEDAQTMCGHCFLPIDDIREKVAKLLVPMPKFDDITEKVAENAAAAWAIDGREKLIKAHDPSMDTIDKIAVTVESRRLINEGLASALDEAIANGDLVNEDGRIYTKNMFNLECRIANAVHDMCKSNPVRFIKPETIEKAIKDVEERKSKEREAAGLTGQFVATPEQRNAARLALTHRISIVSGGPGRGKTAISEIIAHAFLLSGRSYNKEDIIMLAPTGRAAQRITESTGYPAMTAHRAVMAMQRGVPVPNGKMILVDESSMVDIFLASSILSFAKNCNLIFVGDVDQIASVGPGRILRDLIESGSVPCILLKEGHRNSGTIAHNAELINAGHKIDKYCYDEAFVYIPARIDQIETLMISDYFKKVAQYGIKNVMLCAAMRERGNVAVNKLNQDIQALYTKGKAEARFEGKLFRIGDRVMQTKNDYNFAIMRNDQPSEGIFNGEKGSVAKISPDYENESYKLIVLFDDGSVGEYTKDNIANLTLAYATTLHKCQGSEAACMMMAYTFGDYMLLNRSLFYTGETRAKKEFRFYGEEKFQYGKMLSAFDIAVGKTDDAKRNTMLADRIKALA